ncbi:hypothetical protein KAZ93_04800 [Patescibacteria group bacterium]|nr:hypothetical protein [Patescibacteria group bacterium]
MAVHALIYEDMSLFDDNIFVCECRIVDRDGIVRSLTQTDDLLSDGDIL